MSLPNGVQDSPATSSDTSIAQSHGKRKRSHESDGIKPVGDTENAQISESQDENITTILLDIYEILKRCVSISSLSLMFSSYFLTVCTVC